MAEDDYSEPDGTYWDSDGILRSNETGDFISQYFAYGDDLAENLVQDKNAVLLSLETYKILESLKPVILEPLLRILPST